MKILLASPESDVWNSRKHIHMGLGYLAGALLAHGYNVEIWDASVEKEFETLDDRLAREHFDVVGLSAPTPLINSAWESAATAKKHGAVTILGGPHLTLRPHESMEKDMVDLVVRGEAEKTIVEIMAAMEKQFEIDRHLPPGDNPKSKIPDTAGQTLQNPKLCHPDAGWGNILGLCWRSAAGRSRAARC